MFRDRIMVQRRDGKNISDEAEWINADDVKHFTREMFAKQQYRIVIHTEDGQFVHCFSNDAFLRLMSKRHGMIMTDAGVVGNLTKMKSVDYENGKVYFDLEEEEYITISRPRTNLVREYIKKLFGK
ncbi:hypothetical protein [Paenibacillus sp. USHLN196]|uniref:hypothetical protein n=1 Tax=Paenibacillus sp. USHLN196 TaxID=3081291 RepID=UPI0030181C06